MTGKEGDSDMSMLQVSDLSVRYGSCPIVDRVSFSMEAGQWLMIIGPNGAGKTTVINAVSQGAPYTGTVLFEGTDVKTMKSRELARCVGVLTQNHYVGYGFTVEEVVRLGSYARRQNYLPVSNHGASVCEKVVARVQAQFLGSNLLIACIIL